jgi:hypothetical protein
MLDFLSKHSPWFFSGIGVFILTIVYDLFKKKTKEKKEIKNTVKNNQIRVNKSENTTVQFANRVVNNYTTVEKEKDQKRNLKISKLSATEIRAIINECPVFQQEEIAKNYSGIKIKWRVTLYKIHSLSENFVNVMTRYENNYPWVNFKVDLNYNPILKVAKVGKEFIVTGLILKYSSNSFEIDLENIEEA